jgi:hypothetical protein
MIKLLIFMGLRNAELARVRLQDVDLDHCQLHVVQGKSSKDRSVLFPSGFRGELGQYIHGQSERPAEFLFESNRLRPYPPVASDRSSTNTPPLKSKRGSIRICFASDHHFSDPQKRNHQPETATAQRSRGGEKSRDLSGFGSGYEQAMRAFPVR